MIKRSAVCLVILTAACTPQQQAVVTTASSAVEAACNEAVPIANAAALVPGVAPIAAYVVAGCMTAEGLAKLAADPTSAAWVGTLIAQIRALAARVGVKV